MSSGAALKHFCFQHLDSSSCYMRHHVITASSHNTRKSLALKRKNTTP